MNELAPAVICFGEILWDFMPLGLFPGGAPHNVAYHLQQLGLPPHLVSAVGQDLLGDELLRRLRNWGLTLEGLTRHEGLPTGYVTATLGATGDAHYTITTGVAWDQITIGEDITRAAMSAQALVFGSLSQRTACNRAALDRLIAILPPTALRVFDVNLRPPHDDLALVLDLAKRATLLKLNAEEAARLTQDSPGFGREETQARILAQRTGCCTICITAGKYGAGILCNDTWFWEQARPTTVRDTVGAGDAFLAGLLAGLLLQHETPARALARACRLGEFVASRDGATPPHEAPPVDTPTLH